MLSITFLLTKHGVQYAEMGLQLTGRRQQRYRQVLIDIKDAVAVYTLGNIIISVLATIATWIILSILGVPYALALGFVVGFFDFIPLIGATLGAIVVRWRPCRSTSRRRRSSGSCSSSSGSGLRTMWSNPSSTAARRK